MGCQDGKGFDHLALEKLEIVRVKTTHELYVLFC